MAGEAKIGDRIPVLMEKLGLEAVSDLEKGPDWPPNRLISNGLISDWLDKPIGWTSDKLEKFLTGWSVNRVWWRTGEGEVLEEKPTRDQSEPAIAQKTTWEAQTFRKIFEGGTEYLLVPRTAFEGQHRFTSVEQIELQAKELESKTQELKERNTQVQSLTNALISIVKDIASGRLPELSKIEEAQKNTTV